MGERVKMEHLQRSSWTIFWGNMVRISTERYIEVVRFGLRVQVVRSVVCPACGWILELTRHPTNRTNAPWPSHPVAHLWPDGKESGTELRLLLRCCIFWMTLNDLSISIHHTFMRRITFSQTNSTMTISSHDKQRQRGKLGLHCDHPHCCVRMKSVNCKIGLSFFMIPFVGI